MKKLFLLFSLLLQLSVSGVLGQGMAVYPVQVNVSLIAPYSLYLSDYVSGSRDRLLVTLINRDARYRSMPVRLRLTVKGNGFTVQTRPYASVAPLTLEPNLPYRLTVDDLRPYFDSRNLSSQGLGGDSFLKGKRMPEGMVEFGVEVLEYNTGKLLSRKGVGTAWLALQKPPLLSLPFNGETLSWREPLNQLFQWTPQSPGTARVEYELIIKELWDNGMAPESAFAYSPEIFRERIPSTSYLYGVQSPPLEAGHRYAWAVRVVPKDGAEDDNILENDGLSEIRSFRIGRYCPPPTGIKATAERGYIRVDWEGMPEHQRYAVSYRLQGGEEWHDEYSTFPSAMLPGIRAGNTYEYRVAGFCEADVPTYNDHVGKINVPLEDTARLRNCGILRPVDLSNQEPLELLQDGDQFMAGDFPVHVQAVSGGNGYFTGEGYVHVPFLGNAPFKVAFDNIFINTDRRMIRGVVNTVQDASGGGLANLDDIFVGGKTGEVKEGITKTDLIASFAIDPGADFYFDESTGRIEMTDDDGQVVGYIETGIAMTGDEVVAGNGGNDSSVFPMTVRDTTGGLYRIDAPLDESSASPSDVRKKLVVTPVGKSVAALDGGLVNLKRVDDDIARVVFKDCEGSSYAFDEWRPAYSRSYLIRGKYEQIGKEYYVPAKLLPSGKSDKVSAVLEVRDPAVNPERVVFRTVAGTEYRPESYDAGTKTWTLSLVGGEVDDGQELYALYPKSDGGYYNLGKLLVVTYPEYSLKVKIVPVSSELDEFDALRKTLQAIYARAGIGCDVEKLPVFEYDVPSLYQEGSGLFSAYTPEMKSLNAAYASAHGVEEDAAYLFVLSRSGHKKDRNFSGFMPLNKQYGYLFRDDFKDFDDFATAAAHELAHGRLSLRHPFDKSLGLSEGDLPDNLMDYRGGRDLAKWQWDVIHDPGLVVRMFERDKDVMIVTDRNNKTITIRWQKCTPQLIANKKMLRYDAVCLDDKENVTYYRLINDRGIVASYLENSAEVIQKYSITFDKENWHTLSLSDYQDDCLSCELTSLLGQMVGETGKLVGSYALPAEDIYILVTGEDFDGEEASRIAAGGFLVLELVQVGKVAKFIKGGKILATGGRKVDVPIRVFKQFAKKTAEDAVIDLSAQFLVGFVKNAVKHPEEDGYEIAKRTLLEVRLKDAIVAGMIDYASFDLNTQATFDCALKMFSRIEKEGVYIEISTLSDVVLDCLAIFGVRYMFKYMKNTSQYKELVDLLQENRNYDIILGKISDILSEDAIENFVQTLSENSIQATYGE